VCTPSQRQTGTRQQTSPLCGLTNITSSRAWRVACMPGGLLLYKGPLAQPRRQGCRNVQMRVGYAVDPDIDCTDRHAAPPHVALCAPNKHLRALAQLRLGWAHLQVELGRRQRPPVPREQRVCRACCGAASPSAWRQLTVQRPHLPANAPFSVEDLRHFVLECSAHDSIRDGYGLLPPNPWAVPEPGACMRGVLEHANQSALARMLFDMKRRPPTRLMYLCDGP
jgi:hypothetical protein